MLNVSLNKTNVYLFLNQCPQEIQIAELQGRNSEVVLCEPGFSNVCFSDTLQDFKVAPVKSYCVN